MVTWADVDSAIESERQRRAKRVDTVTMAAALLILIRNSFTDFLVPKRKSSVIE